MNGSAHSTPKVLDIHLKRGPAGLGFNIVGGVDQQYIMNDSGIYVAKIKENGAAAQDGRLQEGDKIIMVNGWKLENLSHSAAVELFRTAGEDVQLRVQQRCLSQQNGPFSSQSDGDSSPSFNTQTMITLVATAALATVVGIIVYKRLRGPRSPF
ncbi:synaptojanin-2-binding protein [Triplophysa rosa]|uniref:Synaptojanin-2-binding protein n=1 Tax=Triplophysa rosa TaxID=992332 RepID=A0A9W7WP30_TRIRA|nr:synaptojanin-2-binding protein [Triplophysa rosa]KAI7805777.1 synaptojanin-2-binding protein [Triplophysa rosa]